MWHYLSEIRAKIFLELFTELIVSENKTRANLLFTENTIYVLNITEVFSEILLIYFTTGRLLHFSRIAKMDSHIVALAFSSPRFFAPEVPWFCNWTTWHKKSFKWCALWWTIMWIWYTTRRRVVRLLADDIWMKWTRMQKTADDVLFLMLSYCVVVLPF